MEKITESEKEMLKKFIEKRIKSELSWSWGLIQRPWDQIVLKKELADSKDDLDDFVNSL